MIDMAEDSRKKVERALLVGIRTPDETAAEVEEHLDELADLVRNLDIVPLEPVVVNLHSPMPQYCVGTGKAREIAQLLQECEADCLIFDNPLTPSQQRNWERLTHSCVIDREEVILDIFAERASTREAVLQVELARTRYSLPRLTRAWTHLSRQHGGGATTRGEGAGPLIRIEDGALDGCQSGNVYGCYLHGFFDSESCRRAVLGALAQRKGVTLEARPFDWKAHKERQYDALAQTLREHLDMRLIRRVVDRGA